MFDPQRQHFVLVDWNSATLSDLKRKKSTPVETDLNALSRLFFRALFGQNIRKWDNFFFTSALDLLPVEDKELYQKLISFLNPTFFEISCNYFDKIELLLNKMVLK